MSDREASESTCLLRALERLTVSVEALRSELRAGRERKITTRRVKSAKRAAQVGDFPVDDLAAAAARRAIARVSGWHK